MSHERHDAESMLESALAQAGDPGEILTILGGPAGVAALFDALAGFAGQAIQRHYERRFQVIAKPGEPLNQAQPGDLMIARALGEGGIAWAAPIEWGDLNGGPGRLRAKASRRVPHNAIVVRARRRAALASATREPFESAPAEACGCAHETEHFEESEYAADALALEADDPYESTSSLAARILWPALGFPAVIAPRKQPPSNAPSDATRCLCVLVLSNRKLLSKAEAAEHLRVVAWSERTKRESPNAFTEEELEVRNDEGQTKLVWEHSDEHGDAVIFGGTRTGENSIRVSLSQDVRKFYHDQGLKHLHEIRVSERASARLTGRQHHLLWNEPGAKAGEPSAEMRLLLEKFARPRREALGSEWSANLPFLLEEYKFDYGALHPPYSKQDNDRRLTEVLHPVFVEQPGPRLRIGHVTDGHVDTRADVYEENLLRDARPAAQFYNNFNDSFVEAYKDAKKDSDIILMTGDLIDYGRGHAGLALGEQYRSLLGKESAYHSDRNWFLFYYLLASGERYSLPVYTILGNHDWRLNPYPPIAPGAPDPRSLFRTAAEFRDDKALEALLAKAHGPGMRKFAYNLRAASEIGLFFERPSVITGNFDKAGSPLETSIESVLWYLLLINPFLDYAFPLPGGQKFLMLDWAEDEEVTNTDEPKTFMGFGQRAADSLTNLQKWHFDQFLGLPGKVKVIGIHAPPLGPYPAWKDDDLQRGSKTYKSGEDSRARKPDGKITKLETHTLFAIRPKDAPFGVAADYGSFLKHRNEFIRKAASGGVRLVLSGHIHRNGLLTAFVPGNDRKATLLRGVTYEEARGARPGVAAVRRGKSTQAFPEPLYVNTTSAGPRGNHYGPTYRAVPPGFAIVTLAADGTIENVSPRQIRALPAMQPKARAAGAR